MSPDRPVFDVQDRYVAYSLQQWHNHLGKEHFGRFYRLLHEALGKDLFMCPPEFSCPHRAWIALLQEAKQHQLRSEDINLILSYTKERYLGIAAVEAPLTIVRKHIGWLEWWERVEDLCLHISETLEEWRNEPIFHDLSQSFEFFLEDINQLESTIKTAERKVAHGIFGVVLHGTPWRILQSLMGEQSYGLPDLLETELQKDWPEIRALQGVHYALRRLAVEFFYRPPPHPEVMRDLCMFLKEEGDFFQLAQERSRVVYQYVAHLPPSLKD